MKNKENKTNRERTAVFQKADISSKQIFGNHTLCAQFLRDYSGLSLFADVRPEDIEDVSERYHLLREAELNADTVKKVHIRNYAEGEPHDIYVISLIEHKSTVDYDVTMQLLKYMVCIWENYVKELEERETAGRAKLHGKEQRDTLRNYRGINNRKDFRYPPIYPIVYYEGMEEWTAAWHLKDRILLGDLFQPYIPDITYKLVRTREYSNEELLSKEDEISLVMLINKVQRAEDFQELSRISGGRMNEIVQKAPFDVMEIIITEIQSFCARLHMPQEEAEEIIKEVRGGNMGYLFENMEKMDIQLERRRTEEQRKKTEEERQRTEEQRKKTEEEKQRAEKEKQRAEEEKQRAEEEKQRAEKERQRAEKAEADAAEQRIRAEKAEQNLYRILITTYRKQGMKREDAKKQLITELKMKEKEIDKLIEMFWET